MKKKLVIAFGVLFVCAGEFGVGVFAGPKEVKHVKIDPEKIRAHVKYLASDALEGRGTGQKGGDLSAEYIAAQFKSYGLQPASDAGTYLQSVPMVSMKTLPDTTFTLIPANGSPMTLRNLDDFVTSNESQKESSGIDAPIVFVGYGITAPEYHWNDYKGYDLKGKVALLFVNEPVSDDPNFFKGKALTYYGRWSYKYEETGRRGAVATLIIHRTDLASYGWDVVRNSWGGEKSYLEKGSAPKLQAASWIQEEVAKKLVGMAGLDLGELLQQSQSRDFKPIELGVRLQAHVVSQMHPFVAHNVMAMRAGSEPDKNNEAVLYTAHYDHLGIDKDKAGHNIYNGAVDNATGCGILLELARAWAKAKKAPPRSILFAAVTAEEQGLLGSEYLGKKVVYLPVDPVLDLNYDALAPLGIPEEVEVSGAERTTFYPIVEAAAKEFGLAIRPDPRPEAGHYYRSDHFSLAHAGIPSFSISEGRKFQGHDEAWGEQQANDYVKNRYHQPTDVYRDDWDFKGLAKMAAFGYELGLEAASQSEPIKWLSGDEFEKARKQTSEIDGDALCAGRPDLQLTHAQRISYPPLARQTRISGTVVAKVSVANNGKVDSVEIVSGHPLLQQAVVDSLKQWTFSPQAGEPRTFELRSEFAFRQFSDSGARQWVVVSGPLHLVILTGLPPPLTDYMTSSKKH
ncbi:MAG TPA: TonB family protein [Candidatus Acidoferrum sp.]|nr:TonB family protein [Candidatus Acidoferrum sp.]